MSVVLTDPDGFATGWDWQRCLMVWAVRGDRFGDEITEHQQGTRPGSEFRAGRAARRRWRGQGRSQALGGRPAPGAGARS